MGLFEHRSGSALPKIGLHQSPPTAVKQRETGHLDVVYLALPTTAFPPCQEQDFLIVSAAEASVGPLYTALLTRWLWTKRLPCLPTFGPGLLAVSGYSHVRDAHPEQRGRVLSLLKIRFLVQANQSLQRRRLRG
jgi:hypothetical protein